MKIYEILDAVHDAPTREDKMKVLSENDCLALRDILKINFDSSIKIYVSKRVKWESDEKPTADLKDITKYLVPLSKRGKIEQDRADSSYRAMLQRIHPRDAEYLEAAVKKQLKVKGLTTLLIEGVWGDRILT